MKCSLGISNFLKEISSLSHSIISSVSLPSSLRKVIFLSREGRDLGVAFQTHLVSQALSRGEAKDSILLASRDGYLLEPTKWPKGSQASCGVWKEDSAQWPQDRVQNPKYGLKPPV